MIVTDRSNFMSDLIKNYISGNIILSMIVIDKLQFLYRILLVTNIEVYRYIRLLI